MASVYAFHPRQCDYPHFVGEDIEDINNLIGGFIGGEQCDGCGCSTYRVARRVDGEFVAICANDPDADAEFAHPEPCGTQYRIKRYDEDEVTF